MTGHQVHHNDCIGRRKGVWGVGGVCQSSLLALQHGKLHPLALARRDLSCETRQVCGPPPPVAQHPPSHQGLEVNGGAVGPRRKDVDGALSQERRPVDGSAVKNRRKQRSEQAGWVSYVGTPLAWGWFQAQPLGDLAAPEGGNKTCQGTLPES